MAIHPWSRVDDGIFHHFHIRWIGGLCGVQRMPLFLTPREYMRLPLEATYEEAFRSVPWKFRDVLEGSAP